jgi:hypothetical protein
MFLLIHKTLELFSYPNTDVAATRQPSKTLNLKFKKTGMLQENSRADGNVFRNACAPHNFVCPTHRVGIKVRLVDAIRKGSKYQYDSTISFRMGAVTRAIACRSCDFGESLASDGFQSSGKVGCLRFPLAGRSLSDAQVRVL